MRPIQAVLTGDLIASAESTSDSVDEAMRSLELVAEEFGLWSGHDTQFTRFRGDGWQLHLEDPGPTLAAALALVARLRAWRVGMETRIAIGFGTIDHPGTGKLGLADASGEAFSVSGRTLDRMPRHRRVAVAGPGMARDWHQALFEMALWIARRWTPEQAEVVSLALDPRARRTQAEIAEVLGVTRQAVQARLSGAGWDAVAGAVTVVREHDWSGGDG